MQIIGERIKQLRKQKNLSVEELAKNIGVANKTIESYEKGKKQIRLKHLILLTEFFQIPFDTFLGRDKEIEKDSEKFE